MTRRRRLPRWHLLLSGLVLLLAVVGGFYLSKRGNDGPAASPVAAAALPAATPKNADQFAQRFHAEIDSILAEIGIPAHLINVDSTSAPVGIAIGVPRDLPLAAVNLHLTRTVNGLAGRVIEGLQRSQRRVDLTCGFDTTQTTRIALRRVLTSTRRTGQIGLIVQAVERPAAPEGMWVIAQRLTLLLTPATDDDDPADWRQWANSADHEVIGTDAGADATALAGVREYLAADPAVLDEDRQVAAIERRLWALAHRAADDGHALGVLADHAASRAALRSVLPRLERRGYRFVPATSLLP